MSEFPFKLSPVLVTAFCRNTPHTPNFCGRFFMNRYVQFISSCLSLRTVTWNRLLFCTDLWKYIYFTKGLYLHTTHKGINPTRNVCINVPFRRVRVTAVEVEKQVLQILRSCVCLALVIQHAMGQSGSTILFHIISLMSRLSEEKLLDKKCVFWVYLQLLSYAFLTLIGIQRNTKCLHTSSRNITIMPVRFSRNLRFLDRFSKSNRTSNFMSMSPMRADVFNVDGQELRSYRFPRFWPTRVKRQISALVRQSNIRFVCSRCRRHRHFLFGPRGHCDHIIPY
jgi:hypothetical protein